MPRTLHGHAAIAGIGQTEFSKNSGRSEIRLAVEAAYAAITDAGLTPADIDGMVTFTLDSNAEADLMNDLGIEAVTYVSRTPNGGAMACATVMHAAMAVATGAASAVLVYRAFNERSGHRFGVATPGVGKPSLNWYVPFGVVTPAQTYALWYQRYMYVHGITNADLGRYSVVARQYAATNPNAWFYRQPITLADHQASRWIVEPVLRLLDCCQESDGGVALVITSAARAKDLPRGGVGIVAGAHGDTFGGDTMHNYYHDDLATFPEADLAAKQLWRESGLRPSDMQAAMLYENFSPIVFMLLEAYGFCGPGEAKDFITGGQIDPDGALPVNTHGGLLGEAYIHGLNSIIEGVRQVRGAAVNQVSGVEHVLVSSGASGLILGR